MTKKKIKVKKTHSNFILRHSLWITFLIWISILMTYQLKSIQHIAWIFLGWICGAFFFYQIIINFFDLIWKKMGYIPTYSRYPKNFNEFIYLLIYMVLFLIILYVPIFLIILK